MRNEYLNMRYAIYCDMSGDSGQSEWTVRIVDQGKDVMQRVGDLEREKCGV